MIVWIVDNDEEMQRLHRQSFIRKLPEATVHTFGCLYDAQQFLSKKAPDFIFIDLDAVEGRTLPCFDNHSYFGNLQKFVERFRSAFIVIMSMLISHAKEDVKELKEVCGDNYLFTLDPTKPHALADFCKRYGGE